MPRRCGNTPGPAGTCKGGPDMVSVPTPAEPRPSKTVTLQTWSTEWLGFSVHLKPKTQVGYDSLLRTRIFPFFGTWALDAIDGLEIRRWVAKMHADGVS